MKKFSYKAKDEKGKTLLGVVEAKDEKQAVALLRARKLIVVSITLQRGALLPEVKVFRRIGMSQKVNFTRQLSTMITAGLPITEALSILETQQSPAMSEIVGEILAEVEGGGSLAVAMEKHPEVFDRVYVALVRAGEAAGVLEKVLARLADNLEKQREFKGRVKGAMLYPAIVVVGMITVAAIMMIFVLPNLMVMYEEFEAELPFTTKILMVVSKSVASFWWLGLAGLVGLGYVFSLWRKTKVGRKQYHQLVFKIPILGNLSKNLILTEFNRILGLLVGTGIPLIEALNIVAEATGNEVYKEDIALAAQKVEKGFPLAVSLAESENFPPLVPQMISVGEETGKVHEVLAKLSAYFEMESERTLKDLTTAIEPLIMIVLGVGVGFMMFAIIMPIYNLVSQF